jgi:hypothetical protein
VQQLLSGPSLPQRLTLTRQNDTFSIKVTQAILSSLIATD